MKVNLLSSRVPCTDCGTPVLRLNSWTAVKYPTDESRIVCEGCYRDSLVVNALRPDCPPWGCCPSCDGSGVSGDIDVPGGLCWDCRTTGHDHGRYGTALRVRWRP